MKNITELRNNIDSIDEKIVKLFAERMDTIAEIADYKKNNAVPVMDSNRENEVLAKVGDMAGENYEKYARVLYSAVMDLSRSYQNKIIKPDSEVVKNITYALENTPKIFPEKAFVACQGTAGSYSAKAASKMFEIPNINYMSTFEGVFQAVDKGLCRYGVLPIENSTAGSVNQLYDLLHKYNFYIVKSLRLRVNHVLLANKGAKLSDIHEVISHEQALSQCDDFIQQNKLNAITCPNTAEAAQFVAKSGRNDIAAIASSDCADLYGLEIISDNVCNNQSNYTRFICISKNLEIYPGANRTSFMMRLPHIPGALYRVISKIGALGVNLSKLESRPISGSDFEFMFYFDVEIPVYSPVLCELISELENGAGQITYMGTYLEII